MDQVPYSISSLVDVDHVKRGPCGPHDFRQTSSTQRPSTPRHLLVRRSEQRRCMFFRLFCQIFIIISWFLIIFCRYPHRNEYREQQDLQKLVEGKAPQHNREGQECSGWKSSEKVEPITTVVTSPFRPPSVSLQPSATGFETSHKRKKKEHKSSKCHSNRLSYEN